MGPLDYLHVDIETKLDSSRTVYGFLPKWLSQLEVFSAPNCMQDTVPRGASNRRLPTLRLHYLWSLPGILVNRQRTMHGRN